MQDKKQKGPVLALDLNIALLTLGRRFILALRDTPNNRTPEELGDERLNHRPERPPELDVRRRLSMARVPAVWRLMGRPNTGVTLRGRATSVLSPQFSG